MRNKKLIVIFSVLCALAVLIVLSSVLFSVQHVSAYCYNADDAALEQQVLDNNGIKRGKSIFTLNKKNVADKVESSVANIKVVNVEKKFPNRVFINYVKLFEYFEFSQNDEKYYISNSGDIVRIGEQGADKYIRLYTKGKAVSPSQGEAFKTDSDFDNAVLPILLSAIERLGNRGVVVEFFDYVDFRKNFIYFKTRTGITFELQSTDNALEKLRLAVSVYASFTETANERIKSGTLILTGDKEPRADYTTDDRYMNGV